MWKVGNRLRPLDEIYNLSFNLNSGDEFTITARQGDALQALSSRLAEMPFLARMIWPEGAPRPDPEEYMAGMALWASSRSTCPRARVGAVIYRDGYLLATGYNGAPPGDPHCEDVGCLMESVSSGISTSHHCRRSNHAEVNAIAQAAKHGTRIEGASILTTHSVCRICRGALLTAGITDIKELQLKDNGL